MSSILYQKSNDKACLLLCKTNPDRDKIRIISKMTIRSYGEPKTSIINPVL